MKCPKCTKTMIKVKQDISKNLKTNKKYLRVLYHCKNDDVWLNLETPQ